MYRNRGVDIGSFNILIRLRTVQIGFYRVHLPLGSMPEKIRSKKSCLSWRTVGMIIGPKKVEKSRKISKFYRDLRNSLYKRYKGSSSNPYRILGFPKNFLTNIFREIFSSRKKISEIFWTPMSIQNFQRFQKSYLENQPMSLKMRKLTCVTFFPKFEREILYMVDLI